jgi:5-oxopent-3-ene-1,2,5-tricarboxylate decarboxylase/2-hydroxyhepta-2,4-diene-1,7-dioate isomerase
MIFSVEELVAESSRWMTLLSGDCIFTGTPPGISPLHPGDVCEVSVEGIGVLRNPVVEG